MIEAINKFLNRMVVDKNLENTYQPELKVSKTIEPEERVSYNEVFENINKQLKLKL